jgi:hypothetical protein
MPTLKSKFADWLARRGIRIVTRNSPSFDVVPRNVEPEFLEAFAICGPLSTAPADAMYGLWRAVEYVVRCNIPGDFVECGVFRGGSTAMAALAFRHFAGASIDRTFYLYDTFAGMPAPTARDIDFAGRTPQEHLAAWGASSIDAMANSPLEEVRTNLQAKLKKPSPPPSPPAPSPSCASIPIGTNPPSTN